jgi:hypothetical protein
MCTALRIWKHPPFDSTPHRFMPLLLDRRAVLNRLLAAAPAISSCRPTNEQVDASLKRLEGMKIHGIGRHQINLPKGFSLGIEPVVELTYGLNSDFEVAEVTLMKEGVDLAEFKQRVQLRAAEIAKATHDKLPTSMLAADVQVNERARLLRRYASSLQSTAFDTELFVLVDDLFAKVSARSYDGEYQRIEERLKRIALQQLRKAPDAATAGRGFCVGPLLVTAEQDQEIGSFHFKDPAYPDLLLEISVNAIANQDETLLQRWDSKQHLLKQIGGKDEIVRRGKRRIADMDGEELLTKGLEDDLGSLLFGVESVRRDGSFAKPILSIRLTTGLRDEKSSWSPREAVPVWDAVVNSVRLRPGSV